MEHCETSKPGSKPRLPDDTTFGHGSMVCAVFLAIMLLYWLLRRLIVGPQTGDSDAVPYVLGLLPFGLGNLLAITALFSKKTATAWWGRTALVVIWATIVVWLFAGLALVE